MIQLSDKATGAVIGAISPEELQFLIDQLEEENPDDQDYWLNRPELEILREAGAEAHLMAMLEAAMGDKEDMEIRWEKIGE